MAMTKGASVNPMKKLTRWLTSGMYKLNAWVRVFSQGPLFFILPASALFCLAFSGCDVQEDTSVSFVESQVTHAQGESIQEPVQTSLQFETSSEKSKKTALPRIVAFGDSLTAGLGVAPDEAYPGQLVRRLGEQGFAYDVINAGVSGETSAGGLRRVGWILKNQPVLVIVELGVNDGLRGQPLKDTYDNLNAIIQRFKNEGVIVVLAGMRLPLNYGDDYTREFSALYERLAKEHDVPFIPFFLEGVAMRRDLNQGDGIHPTAEGYAIVVTNVWETLQPILKELAHNG